MFYKNSGCYTTNVQLKINSDSEHSDAINRERITSNLSGIIWNQTLALLKITGTTI